MSSKLFLSFALATALPMAAAVSNAQAPGTPSDPATQSQPATASPDRAAAQLTGVQARPQGYPDPNLNPSSDKPHAGTPLPDGATPPAEAQPAQPNQPPDWYKESPQAYDHRTAKPRHLHAAGKQLQIYDDTPPARQVAQEEPPQQDAQPYPGQPYNNQPSPHVQSLPRYYGQPEPQAEPAPEPQQNYPPQGYPQQGNPQQNYPQQNQNDPQDYASQGGQDYPQDDYGPQAGQPVQPSQQPLAPQQLEQIVAPIALYPDQLVAQILTAATYPAQITAADQLVRSMNGAPPEQIAQSAGAQSSWDPSIKALTAFPQVLAMLDGNLQWTAALGNAYYNQPQDVLETIQVLRQRAQESGNLQSTPQEQIVQQPNYIQIQPADPQYIYVPSYNPWYVYGAPIAPYPTFAFGTSGLYIGGGVEYGLGFAVAPFFRFPYFSAWGCDWRGGGVLFNHGSYWSHSHEVHDWGFAHGGRRWDGGHGGSYGGYGGRESARFGDYHNQPLDVHNGNGFNHSPMGRGFGGPQQPFAGRPQQGFGHLEGGGPSRQQAPGQQAYGRMPPAIGRPEPFQGRMQPYGGQSFAGRPPMTGGPQNFGARPQNGPQAYARPSPYAARPQQFSQMPRPGNGPGGYSGYGGYSHPGQGYMGRSTPPEIGRAPQQNYAPRAFGGGSSGWGNARPQQPSSHAFYGGSGHAFSGGGPSFGGGGGHSFSGGGSHSYGGGGGSHSYGGGGGHSSGGGGYSGGGGHSGGGHRR